MERKDSAGTPNVFSLDVSRLDSDGGSPYVAIYSLLVPATISGAIKNTNAATWIAGVFDEWSGNATSNILDQTNSRDNTNTGANSTDTNAINTGPQAGLALACINNDRSGDLPTSTGTNFIQDSGDPSVAIISAMAYRTASVANQSGLLESWTWTALSTSSACIASYNAPATGFPGLPAFQLGQSFVMDI